MSFDRTIEVSDYYTMAGSTGDGDDGDMGPSDTMPPLPGYRYERKGAALLENAALGVYDFHKQLPDSYRMEIYSKEFSKTVNKFNKAFEKKFMPEITLPAIFAEAKKEENLKYKKGGSRRRAYTGRKAAEAEEKEKRRRLRAASIEAARKINHDAIIEAEAEVQVANSQLELGEGEIQEDVTADSDDDDIEYLGTQPTQSLRQPSSDNNIQLPASIGKGKARQISSSSESELDLAGFQDIDDIDPIPTAPPLLDGIAARRSQQQTFSQLPSQHRIPTSSAATGTRGARGEALKKSKKLESQERRNRQDAEMKAERAVKRVTSKATAAARREEKRMEPRKDDVS